MGNRRRINGSGVLRTGYYVWKTTSSNKVLVCRDRLLVDGERIYGQTHSRRSRFARIKCLALP